MGIEIETDRSWRDHNDLETLSTYTDIQGKAALQSIAAARAGAKTSLIGVIGNDLFAKNIKDTLRKEGIQSLGMLNHETETGTTTLLKYKDEQTRLSNIGANQHAHGNQIPNAMLHERTLLLLQNELSPSINTSLMKRAKQRDTKVIMSLKNEQNISDEYFELSDIIIANQNTAQKCNLKTLKQKYNFSMIITQKDGINGATATSPRGAQQTYTPPASSEIIDRSGCYDVFCGTISACIQAALPMQSALQYATIAAGLCATVKGTYRSFPYLGNIEEYINNQTTKEEEQTA